MDRASLAVQYVFLFTLAAGVVVLLAAVQSTRDERRYESAMLRTLGASRGTVLQGVAAEFSALGFLSGTLAAFGATGVGWVLARRLFSLQYTLDPWVWVVGLVCGTILVGVSGTLATRRVVNTPPITHLARRMNARRAFSALRGSASRSGIGAAAKRQRLDAHRVDAGGESRGIERHAQFAVRILEQIVQNQRASLILLVDEHAELHQLVRVARDRCADP